MIFLLKNFLKRYKAQNNWVRNFRVTKLLQSQFNDYQTQENSKKYEYDLSTYNKRVVLITLKFFDDTAGNLPEQ